MEKLKFSIVCSAYNAENYISECILSVVNNGYKEIELIILDDGSTDNTYLICEEFAKKDSRIKVFHNENIGPYNERIIGYKKASGDYLLSIDSDDLFKPEAFNFLNTLILKNNYPDLVLFNAFLEEEGNVTILDAQRYLENPLTNKDSFLSMYLNSYSLNQALFRKCFRKELLNNNIDLSERAFKMYEDGLFSLRIIKEAKSFLCSNQCIYTYKIINSNSLTKTFQKRDLTGIEVLEETKALFYSITVDRKLLLQFNSILIRFEINKIVSCSRNRNFKEYYHFLKKNISKANINFLRIKTSRKYMGKIYYLRLLLIWKFFFLFSLISWRFSNEI